MKRYSEEHQWVEWQNGIAVVGITSFMADEMGEIEFVELPELHSVLTQGDVFCVVESAKSAVDVAAPIGGTVCEVNQRIVEAPDLINTSPEGAGWICKLQECDDEELESLMDEAAYELQISGEGE